MPVSIDTNTATIAANRDYAQPVYAALRADRPFTQASSGFAGTASDGLAQLDATHSLATTYATATTGNVVQTAKVDAKGGRPFQLSLGFGATQASAVATAGASASRSFDDLYDAYQDGWERYDHGLNPAASPKSLTPAQRKSLRRTYLLSANVLKASEDKTFPGATVAGLGSPWGQAVAAGDPALTYFGSYREVFARDLYETFTGFVASGDIATAKATVRFLFERQQQPDGSMPRNSLVNGKTAPDSFGVQLDEVAYPILMARTVGLTDKAYYTRAHQARGGLRRRARADLRQRALGGAERVLAVDHRGRDRRPRGGRLDRREERRRRRRPHLPGDGRLLPAEHQEVDRHHERPAQPRPLLHPALQER